MAWVILAILILVGDYLSGPVIQFPILYLLPVSLAAWYNELVWALVFAMVLPIIRFYFVIIIWGIPWGLGESLINTLIRILVLSAFALLTYRTAEQTRRLAQRVRVLEGILPVCSFCKKIRDLQGQWHSMESFITERSEATFSHGFCPECGERHYAKYRNPPQAPQQDLPMPKSP
ncbi:MAG: hypothetical protein AB7P17_13045 [Nitrospirales bacterium]